jgi:hypothetical protein
MAAFCFLRSGVLGSIGPFSGLKLLHASLKSGVKFNPIGLIGIYRSLSPITGSRFWTQRQTHIVRDIVSSHQHFPMTRAATRYMKDLMKKCLSIVPDEHRHICNRRIDLVIHIDMRILITDRTFRCLSSALLLANNNSRRL